ncbi:MAG: hypothetical protein BWY31_01977 [Lentisphaerae bacterium ADurb.Bin242]|nr:MAG: hypothetical protein BWY31_01977 [Lentisphaerae bacterium ADurb.Bin242]
MTDNELIRSTLDRLNLTYKEASSITGMSETTFKRYGTVSAKVKPAVWRSLLEYEATSYIRQQDINTRAASMGATATESPKRRGRPRQRMFELDGDFNRRLIQLRKEACNEKKKS